MKKISLFLALATATLGFHLAHAQVDTTKSLKKHYWMSASEIIFSGGSVEAVGGPEMTKIDVNPIVRFTCFFHLQEQFHFDFNESIGIFTGAGIRNVGMINDLNDSIKLKQRVYSLGIPVAVKFGSLPNRFYVALGGEFELFFHYKQKAFYDDEKFKKTEWFSDKVNLVNPSVFLDLHSARGAYIRFKYYLLDFLVEDKQSVKIDSEPYSYFPESSKMFYVAIGTSIQAFTSKKSKSTSQPINTTQLY
jgi:hypothetical protein